MVPGSCVSMVTLIKRLTSRSVSDHPVLLRQRPKEIKPVTSRSAATVTEI